MKWTEPSLTDCICEGKEALLMNLHRLKYQIDVQVEKKKLVT